MILGYILAKVEAGEEKETLEKIRAVNGVKRSNATYGIYDLIVEVNFGSIEELDEFVFNKLRKMSSVKETVTIICSEIVK